ncbi:MAG: hypothetical protein GEU79_04975 [Acidimicrobiia bacterium]|nr:hypothetical protein [Acidimicrobiia bacterium]
MAVFTHEIQSSKPLRFVIELGRPVPIHAGAAGRAILAGLPPEEAEELLGGEPLQVITPNTISDPGELLRLADEDRKRGFAVSIEERVPGGASAAAPFFDRGGRCVGSIVFTIPLARLEMDSIDQIGVAVSESAVKLTEQLRSVRHPRDSGLTSR